MNQEKTKGIVLRSIPFKDRQKILTIFTEEIGLMTLIIKGLSKSSYLLPFTETFCEAEWIYARKSSDLCVFHDGSIFNLHLPLRQKYTFLQTALEMAHAILSTQMAGKHSPDLYVLFSAYLKQIPQSLFPNTLLASFYLKMLKHEGVLDRSLFQSYEFKPYEKFLSPLFEAKYFREIASLEIPSTLLPLIKQSFQRISLT